MFLKTNRWELQHYRHLNLHLLEFMYCKTSGWQVVCWQDSKVTLQTTASMQQQAKDCMTPERIDNLLQPDTSSAVRSYKRTKNAQLVQVSKLIQEKKKFWNQEIILIKKMCYENDSKCVTGSREIHIEQEGVSFKMKF